MAKIGERNKKQLWYSNYLGLEEYVDEDGYRTGNDIEVYSPPVCIRANVSPAKGKGSIEIFGESLNYTKTITTDILDCPIDEHTILWIDIDPVIDEETGCATIPHNYECVSVAKGLTNISYAIKKVDVS